MRRSLLIAAFLGSTFLTATPAEAAEVTGLLTSLGMSIAGSAAALGVKSLSTIAAQKAFAAAFTKFGTQVLVNIGVNAVLSLLQPKPKAPSPADRKINYAQPISYFERGYGEIKKSSPMGFNALKDKTRHYAVIIAAHQTEGPVAHYLDNTEVTLDGTVDIRAAVVTVATSNITLSGEQTIEGVAVVSGDRVLVTGQTDASENGIWVAASGAWSRADDMNTDDEVADAAVSFDGLWYWVSSFGGTIGVDDMDWSSGTDLPAAEVATSPFDSYGSIRAYTGTEGQPADATAVAAFTELTDAYDFAGLSYAFLTARRPPQKKILDVYPELREWNYLPVWRMANDVYDPRTDTYGYTDNFALCFAHEIVNYWNLEVDWDEIGDQADVCDQEVTNGDGGTQAKWTCNAYISEGDDFDQIRANMLATADVFLYERVDGKVGFKVGGQWAAPTVTLTDSDFLSLKVASGKDLGVENEYVVNYVEPGNDYQLSPTGAIRLDPEGNDDRKTWDVPFCNTHNQAARLADRFAKAATADYQVSGTIKPIGFDLIGQRFVRLESASLGLSMDLEIDELWMNGDQITFDLVAHSTSEDEHTGFVAATDEPDQPTYDLIEDEDTVPDVSGLSGTGVETTGGSASIKWSWTEQDDSYTQQVRYRKVGDTDWILVDVPAEQDFLTVSGLNDGATYEAQVRNQSSGFRVSENWQPGTPETVVATANQTEPESLEAFSATGGAGTAQVDLTAPNDPNYYATRIYRGDTTTFGDASLVRTEYGAPGADDQWTDTGLSAGTYYYWGVPINRSGIPSETGSLPSNGSGPVTATVT